MMSALAKYVRWDTVSMFVAIAIVLTLELMGVFTDKYVTITAIIRAYVPKWLLAMVWGWLGWHFVFGAK